MIFTAEAFLAQIEDHLTRRGLSATAFGQSCVGDPNFVFDLRAGRMPSLRLVERVQTYMAGESERVAS